MPLIMTARVRDFRPASCIFTTGERGRRSQKILEHSGLAHLAAFHTNLKCYTRSARNAVTADTR